MAGNESKRVTAIMSHPIFIEKINIIEEKEKDREFCKHGIEHLLSVARIAEIINLKENLNIDEELIYATSLLHDIGRSEEGNHEEKGCEIAKRILSECGFADEEVYIITEAILEHRHNIEKSSKEVNIMCDVLKRADHLSRNCFLCSAIDECNWDDDRKNKTILY